jgi:hypothetical protein
LSKYEFNDNNSVNYAAWLFFSEIDLYM